MSSLAPWVAAALALHASLALLPGRAPEPPRPAADSIEIDLPAPPSVSEATPPAPTAATPTSAPIRAAVSAPIPARASTTLTRAAPILTAAPSPDADPVSFVTDPSGNPFGYGVVVRGGAATQVSARPGGSVPARQAAPPQEISTAHSDWTHAPRLDEPDPCSGFFPRHAVADVGRVALVVVIDPGGRVASTSVADESPPGDGFGQAARTCLGTKIFTPALDRDGRPTGATATVRIRFSR